MAASKTRRTFEDYTRTNKKELGEITGTDTAE